MNYVCMVQYIVVYRGYILPANMWSTAESYQSPM